MSISSTVIGREEGRVREEGFGCAGRNGSSGLKNYFSEKQEGDVGEREQDRNFRLVVKNMK